MKLLADDQIPLIAELFGQQFEVIQKAGALINSNDLKDVELLLVRTVTPINQALLANSSVRFIGTATAGIDHLDHRWLEQAGIAWANAKGANANAVVNYVVGCIAALQTQGLLNSSPKVGIIGAGEIGARLAKTIAPICSEIYLNDPPRAETEADFNSTSLEKFRELDLISLHTPLTREGAHPTYHLIDETFLAELNPRCVLINTARGGIINEEALLKLTKTPVLALDVWEDEPNINLPLLTKTTLATPHIAGYSQAAKYQASLILYQRICEFFKLTPIQPALLNSNTHSLSLNETHWQNQVLTYFNPLNETAVMKKTLSKATSVSKAFETLRRNYRLREEF